MSKLSELIPAGGSAKELSAVASGTLPNGRPVILNSNGTVTAVTGDGATQTVGTPTSAATGADVDWTDVAYDTYSNKIIAVYSQGSNGCCSVGTVSGNTISFGTRVVFNSSNASYIAVACGGSTGKIMIVFKSDSNRPYGIIGVVSGTTINFGTRVTADNNVIFGNDVVFDSNQNRFVHVYGRAGPVATIGTVSGTNTLTYDGKTTLDGDASANSALVYDSNSNKVVSIYRDNGVGKMVVRVGTVTGADAISFGSEVQISSQNWNELNAVFDSSVNKIILVGKNASDNNYGVSVCITVNGSSASAGTPVAFRSAVISYPHVAYDSTANKQVLSFIKSGVGEITVGTLTGTTLSWTASTINFTGDTSTSGYSASTYDPDTSKVVTWYRRQTDGTTIGLGTGVTFQAEWSTTNLTATNFVGFASEAIASGATGVINPIGGVAASVSNTPLLQVYGSEVVFNAGNVGWPTMDFDPNSAGKFVVCYRDTNGYGTAIVGTVSGNSITYGSEFVFEAASTNDICISFDPNTANKFLIVYQDAGSSSNGTAIVGTVSGTSLSFGSKVVFNSGDTSQIGLDCDPNTANKYVISYRNSANNNEGIALIGTVSGTSISFGSKVTFNSGITGKTSPAFDPNTAGKFVQIWINYSVSNQSEARVGTVSGTSISFGSTVTFDTGGMNWNTIECDPNTAGKYVIAYTDQGNSSFGTAIVGTVSGTSISFGTAVVYSSVTTGYNSIGFDPNNSGKCVIAYQDTPNSSSGTSVMGTVSGTSISFGSKVVFNGNSSYFKTVFDPNTAGKYVISYRDSNGYGASIVGNLSNALTIGSTYYVQGNGTVSTVSTSPAVNAGKAISATSLLLKG